MPLFRVEYEDGGEWFLERGWVPETGSCVVKAIDHEHAAERFYDRTTDTMSESRRVTKVTRLKEDNAPR